MAAVLDPMHLLGSADPLYYAELDYAGLETLGWSVAPADFSGFNEIVRFSRDSYDWLLVEHFANGVHKTLKIAKAVIYLNYTGSPGLLGTYAVSTDLSYLQDTAGGYLEATTLVATLVRLGAGQVQVTLSSAVASTGYQIQDLTPGVAVKPVYTAGTGVTTSSAAYARSWLITATSTTVFVLQRREWTDWTALMSNADGPICFALFVD
jgi:hypothetical protein